MVIMKWSVAGSNLDSLGHSLYLRVILQEADEVGHNVQGPLSIGRPRRSAGPLP